MTRTVGELRSNLTPSKLASEAASTAIVEAIAAICDKFEFYG
jgi:hypothetical protein